MKLNMNTAVVMKKRKIRHLATNAMECLIVIWSKLYFCNIKSSINQFMFYKVLHHRLLSMLTIILWENTFWKFKTFVQHLNHPIHKWWNVPLRHPPLRNIMLVLRRKISRQNINRPTNVDCSRLAICNPIGHRLLVKLWFIVSRKTPQAKIFT